MVRPQFTDRAKGKDGRKYLVSTIQFGKSEASEIWETAVFDWAGFFTPSENQRYTMWTVDAVLARAAHADALQRVKTEPADSWMMASDVIEKERETAIGSFQQEESVRYYEQFQRDFGGQGLTDDDGDS